MLLRRVETENFLSHEEESVALPEEGMFLLSGPSGSGKSSFIVDAVAYSLFGVVATRARRGEDLRTRGISEEMSVRVTFDFPDRRLVVARGIDSRGSSWAQVYEDKEGRGVLLAEGSAPVQRLIRRELGGMTWQQFYAAFVARQSEIAMLTSLRGAERKALVQRMLGMRELEKTAEIISANIRRYSAEADELMKTRNLGDIESLREEAASLASQIEDKEKEAARLREDLDRKKELAKELGRRAVLARGAEQRKIILEKIGILEERLQSAKSSEEIAEKAAAASGEIPNLEKEILRMEKRQDDLRETYRLSLEKSRLSKELAEMPPVQKSLLETEEKLRAERLLRSSLYSDIELFDQRYSDLEEKGECDLCLRPFSSSEDLQRALEEIKSSRQKKEEDLLLVQKKIDLLERDLPNAEREKKLDGRRSLLEERLFELNNVLGNPEDIKEEGLTLGKKIEAQRSSLAEKKLLADQKNSGGSSEEISAEIKKLQASLPPESDEDKSVIEEALQADKEAAFLKGRIPEISKQLDDIRRRHHQKKKELQNKEEDAEKLQDWNRKAKDQESLQTYLQAYQKHLAHEIRPALEEIGSEMIRRVSGGKHVAIRVDDNYEIEIEDSQGRRLSAGMISGGEAVRANICLRLALTRLVSQRTGVPVAFLVFDEPLPAQDSGHIERIIELLDSLRPFYKQQFIISHVGDLAVSREVDYLLSFEDGPELFHA